MSPSQVPKYFHNFLVIGNSLVIGTELSELRAIIRTHLYGENNSYSDISPLLYGLGCFLPSLLVYNRSKCCSQGGRANVKYCSIVQNSEERPTFMELHKRLKEMAGDDRDYCEAND